MYEIWLNTHIHFFLNSNVLVKLFFPGFINFCIYFSFFLILQNLWSLNLELPCIFFYSLEILHILKTLNIICIPKFPNFISFSHSFPWTPDSFIQCVLDISTWIPNSYIKVNMPKTLFINFSLKLPTLPLCSTSHLMIIQAVYFLRV